MDQDGVVQEDKHVAEITHLMSRAAGWPDGLRWIVRRTKPSRRQARNLTAFERATGWRYSIIVTNIPAARGIGRVPGSHHAQFIDVLHRQHAVVEDGVRAGKSMGLRTPPPRPGKEAAPAQSEPVPPRAHRAAPPPASQLPLPKTRTTRSVTDLAGTLNHRGQ